MGLGKTWEALGLMAWFWHVFEYPVREFPIRSPYGVLICPPSMTTTWVHGIQSQLTEFSPNVYWIKKSKDMIKWETEQEKKPQPGIILISYKLLSNSVKKESARIVDRIIHRWKPSFFIADEAQAVRNEGTKQSRAIIDLADSCAYGVLMSGTPSSYPEGMWTAFRILWPSLFGKQFTQRNPSIPSFPCEIKSFAWRYCGPVQQRVRGIESTCLVSFSLFFEPHYDVGQHMIWTYKGCERYEELHEFISLICVRKTKDEVNAQRWKELTEWLHKQTPRIGWTESMMNQFIPYVREPQKIRRRWDFDMTSDAKLLSFYKSTMDEIR